MKGKETKGRKESYYKTKFQEEWAHIIAAPRPHSWIDHGLSSEIRRLNKETFYIYKVLKVRL